MRTVTNLTAHRFLCLAVLSILLLPLTAIGTPTPGYENMGSLRGGNTPTASLSRPGLYDYSPMLLKDANGKYKLWWCGKSTQLYNGRQQDAIFYSESTSLTGTWTTPQQVFTASHANTFDRDHVCDPSVIRVNGTYYMYYGGLKNDYPSGGGITYVDAGLGVASSTNGINWTRLNSGQPILRTWDLQYSQNNFVYTVGQPSLAYVDGWYYMLHTDGSGQDGGGIYVLRSRDLLFPKNANTEELLWQSGQKVFLPWNQALHTTARIRDGANFELIYHTGLKQFLTGVNGVLNVSSIIFFDKTFNIEHGVAEIPNTQWTEGPSYVRDTWGRNLLEHPEVGLIKEQNLFSGNCSVALDEIRSVGDVSVTTWELAYAGGTLELEQRCGDLALLPQSDFDGDTRADQAIWRPSNGTHYIRNSSIGLRTYALGASNYTPIKGDFDGDSKADYGVVYEVNGLLWWTIVKSSNGATRTQPTWGVSGDQLAIGDYDGDGKDDFGIFRNGQWWVIFENQTTFSFNWGVAGDIGVPMDIDGDGIVELAVYRPNLGTWFVWDYQNSTYREQQWGLPGDVPVAADYFADGKSDFAVWRPSNGTWYLKNSVTGAEEITQFGLSGDVPVVGDFDGDGKVDLTVWRNANGNWYHNYRNGGPTIAVQFGLAGDKIHKY